MQGILKRILDRKAVEIAQRKIQHPLGELVSRAKELPAPRGFAEAIAKCVKDGGSAVIAEAKRASPSKGVIRPYFDPAAIARSYERGGATCLSVLTDVDFFQGSDDCLREARAACSLPVLRKDFIVDPYQLYETRAMGADAVLLIVAALDDDALLKLALLATELQLDVLCEVHNADELGRALTLPVSLIGVNNRDLRTFQTSLATSLALRPLLGEDHILVSESGIRTSLDVAMLRRAGIHAFLVGEAFMRAADPGSELNRLFYGAEAEVLQGVHR